jgi:two-component system, response regulator PdtaR
MQDRGVPRGRGRVLLVEDEPLISDIAAEALQEQGFEVETAANAGDALRRLAAESPVDILFTDIDLPGGMDGTALARCARRLRSDLPVIFTSGRYRLDVSEAVAGAMFLPKPYDLNTLGRIVGDLVFKHEIAAAIA